MPKTLVNGTAKTIRRLRNDRGLSQEDLAAKAGLDRTYISGIERGVRNITLGSLESIILALGLEVNQFISELNKDLREME